MSQHDSSYHALFSHPELIEDLLRNFVAEDWVSQLDFSRIERINAKFHADDLNKREGDLIYRIHFKSGDGEIYVYLLLEFQSQPDKWMPLRTMVYVGLLYQQLIKEKQLTETQQLPPVFPLVLYNGDQPWSYSQDLKSLIALPQNSPLRQWQPQMNYYLLDESTYPNGKDGSVTAVLFGIENAKNIKEIRDYIKALEELIPQTKASLRRAFVTWIRYVLTPHKGLKLDNRDIQDLTEVREMLATRIKQWEQEIEQKIEQKLAEGLREGLREGRKEGRQEGRKEGEATLLYKMLELKFAPLPEWTKQKVDQADSKLLEQWAANLLNATTLEDVFN